MIVIVYVHCIVTFICVILEKKHLFQKLFNYNYGINSLMNKPPFLWNGG